MHFMYMLIKARLEFIRCKQIKHKPIEYFQIQRMQIHHTSNHLELFLFEGSDLYKIHLKLILLRQNHQSLILTLMIDSLVFQPQYILVMEFLDLFNQVKVIHFLLSLEVMKIESTLMAAWDSNLYLNTKGSQHAKNLAKVSIQQ